MWETCYLTLNLLVWSSCSIFQHIPYMVITTRFIWGQWRVYILYMWFCTLWHQLSGADCSVKLIAQWSWLLSGMKWCNNLWKSLLCYPRLRFLGEGPCQRALFSNWWSYNNLVSLLCLWTYSWRLCSNLNFGHILEKHGCPDWSIDNWPIRVDPCFKTIYIYI